jgi:hypothetical protein
MGFFDSIDLGGLQKLLFPVIEALGGPDIRGEIEDKGRAFNEAGEILESVAAILHMVGEASADGIIDNGEVAAVIAAAPTVEQAVKDLFDLFEDAD